MIEIIPAIDLIEGKCVRLSQGDFSKRSIYNQSPLEAAKWFEGAGIVRLHLVDLDGARTGKITSLHILESIAGKTSLKIDFSGGIKTNNDIESVFNAGAAIAAVGSIAVKQPELLSEWIKIYGDDKILIGADVKNEKIVLSGWIEKTDISIFDFISDQMAKGAKNIFCTDVSKDGEMKGASTELYKKIIEKFPSLNLIASGGVSCIDDIEALQAAGCKGVIIGKAIYEGKITLKDLIKFT